MNPGPYIPITPVRNEEQFLQGAIDSMARQVLRPQEWIIVDDGSTDRTGEIALAAAGVYPWITVIRRPDRGYRKAGGGVIEAFYDGYRAIKQGGWQFVAKLDGDLSFEPDYFERCLARFEKDPTLGIGGGAICAQVAGCLLAEAPGDPAFHVRGATKIYKRDCWEAIGGLMQAPGWDTVDEFKANMLGWATYTFKDIKVCHHRHAGGAYGAWNNWVKNGLANYVAGYHPLFMLVKCLRRAVRQRSLTAAAGLGCGYLKGCLRRAPRAEARVVRYVQRQQLNQLLLKPSLWSGAGPAPCASSARGLNGKNTDLPTPPQRKVDPVRDR